MADGKVLVSGMMARVLVGFGKIQTFLTFTVLDCKVNPILG